MDIYLAGSMAGGRKFEEKLKLISDTLEDLGHKVLTKENVVLLKVDSNRDHSFSERKWKMQRDKRRIRNADIFIAEVSTYSHGVGYEHSYAESLGKPVLLLRHASLKNNHYSPFLDGSDHDKFMFAFYDQNDIEKILTKFITKYGE